MKVDILAFGIAKDIFGKKIINLELDGSTTEHLKELLENQYPELKKLSSYMIAVNNEYASNELQLKEGDEIAIIPPVSGG
jgi:molybdopterin synthase sulfur carrier subunit